MFDVLFLIVGLVMVAPALFASCITIFAAVAAPPGRHGGIRSGHLVSGALVALCGLAVMGFAAWSTRHDGHYDDFEAAVMILGAMAGASVFVVGLGPFVPWLLGVLGRGGTRLPVPLRLAARHLADQRRRTSPAVALTMGAAAAAVIVAIVGGATTAQARANYVAYERPGTLIVSFSPQDAAAARAAVQEVLPGVPVAERLAPHWPSRLVVSAQDGVSSGGYIGDEALLRYLTGNLVFPYDEGRAVTVTAGDDGFSTAEIDYYPSLDDRKTTTSIPAIVVEPVSSGLDRVFIPAKVLRDLGVQLGTEALVVDPSLRRVSDAERDRLQERLGENGEAYLEQGFQEPTGPLYASGTLTVVALVGALVATVCSRRSPRLLHRVGGSSSAVRALTACRAALAAASGTVTGAVVGCVAGLLLAWPFTASVDWEAPPRVPFETPWVLIVVLAAALPLLAAGLALLGRPRRDER
ncbi:hypothetical protein MF672_017540 [Actinomadura sp. ATCC 31491]|uniref:FtsX-like permease family protein n=1 Tax=Actinomadura luzonensis TaxID=2805427 RepID=A0ABT0FTB2_9ACTN|nr:hypothetical protein [Actinomadura luzonensis]MCK2215576.1 hypothetical protein [Actinomadura luzonensis]